MQTLTEEISRMKTLMEGVPRDQLKEVTVLYRDGDGCLEDIIDYIRVNGNGGHSFSINIDGKEFYWDGDGADYIKEIKVDGQKYENYKENIDGGEHPSTKSDD